MTAPNLLPDLSDAELEELLEGLEFLEDEEAVEAVRILETPTDEDFVRWRIRGPIAWAVDRLGIREDTLVWTLFEGYEGHTWDGDRDPFVQASECLARFEDVGIESATGTGKTFWLALVVLWFLDVFRPPKEALSPSRPGATLHTGTKVVTAAPKEEQLRLGLWTEIRELWPRFERLHPDAVLSDLRIRMRPKSDKWGAVGFATGVGADEKSATKAQGFHAEFMLIVLEETPGIHPAVLTAFENTSVGATNVRVGVGNPDHTLDGLHQYCVSPGVKSLRVSGYDHPNVVRGDPSFVPGAVTAESLERRLKKYGEESAIHISRSRGICPTEGAEALIRLSWCYAARDLAKDPTQVALRRRGPRALGVDVANSEAGDLAALAFGQGAVLERVEDYRCPDANVFGRLRIAPLIGPTLAPANVGIDTVGVGAGCYNEVKRLGKVCRSLQGGAVFLPDLEEEFASLRAQMWWVFRVELFALEFILPDDAELFQDLITPKWGIRAGKIWIEPKEDLCARLPGRRSPNKGDAAVYWNWVRKDRTPKPRGKIPSRSSRSIR